VSNVDSNDLALWLVITVLGFFVILLLFGVLPPCSQQCGGYGAVAPSSNVDLRLNQLEDWAYETASKSGEVSVWQQNVTADLNDLCELHPDDCPEPEAKTPPPANPPPFP